MNGTKNISLALFLLLSATALRATDTNTVRAFGLAFTVISNAVIALDEEYAAIKVLQIGGPECGQPSGTGTNDIPDAIFGISVHTGEAQSGVYIYPYAECRENGLSMWGNAFGAVNGETNRLLSSIKGTRVEWGEYQIEADFTPLGATSYTYQVWSHGFLMLQVTNHGPISGLSTYNVEDRDPRVNPIVITDLGPAAFIEFPYGTQFGVSGDATTGNRFVRSAVGDRMIIIAQGTTNHPACVSRVDVFGSDRLPSFAINDTRIGMFGRPHKALGAVNFAASNGRLTAAPFDSLDLNDGLVVDFKYGASRWTVQTEPFPLNQTNAVLFFSASGLASIKPGSAYSGPVSLARSNDAVALHADFQNLGAVNSLLRVFRNDVLAGTIYGPGTNALATLTSSNLLVIGWTVAGDSISTSIATPSTLISHDGTTLEGDRFEFAPQDPSIRLGYLDHATVLGSGIDALTITSEATHDAPRAELRLQMERLPSGLLLSWPYERYFYLTVRSNLSDGYVGYDSGTVYYRDFRYYLPITPTNAARFYWLQHVHSYYLSP